jgi:hypothetical protein
MSHAIRTTTPDMWGDVRSIQVPYQRRLVQRTKFLMIHGFFMATAASPRRSGCVPGRFETQY